VKYILGYNDELSQKIKQTTSAVNIALDSLAADEPASPFFSSFIMNLIR